jgi:hypothetical protein
MRTLIACFAAIAIFVCVSQAAPPQPAVEEGFTSLFNGKDLTGWQTMGQSGPGYLVSKGVIYVPKNGGGNLFTDKEFSDFIFRFEFKLSKNGNNGVGIRAPLKGDAAYVGMEIQILDDTGAQYRGKLHPEQYTGSIYDVIAAKQGHLKPVGQWNQEEITAQGRHITVKLNGAVIVDADLDSVKDPEKLKKHPGLARTSGHIGFLGHHTKVSFRNIRVKPL